MLIPVNMFTTSLILICALSSVESTSLIFYHGSLSNYTVTPVEQPLVLLPFFNKTLVSVFYFFGFGGTPANEDVTLIMSAYLNTGYTNVVCVDWSNEAGGVADELVLTYVLCAALNIRIVGRDVGRALVTLFKNGICDDKIHLIGHSLGGQVVAYTGEYVKEHDFELGRITGLDPAGPLFQGLMNLGGLSPASARFVDVLHTNPQIYGAAYSIGSVDFWPNCEDTLQPGCNATDTFCSHFRSFYYFAEAILSPKSFVAVKADNCTAWPQQKTPRNTIFLGDLVNTCARGNYYFSTNSQPPFAKGRAGLVPNS